MFSKLMDVMFGCRHDRYSFPITLRPGSRRNRTTQRTGTYVACLDCGREFRYDWQEMKIVGSQTAGLQTIGSRAAEIARSLVTREAA